MAVPTDITEQLAEHAEEIRKLARRTAGDLVEIGQRLCEAKKIAGHGLWLTWLRDELGMTPRAAQRLMSVASLAGKYDIVSHLDLSARLLYLLAARSTPSEVVAATLAPSGTR
jgi:hypothetical protein